MDFSWLSSPSTYMGFVTLIFLEIVLSVDNLIFIAIVANKASPKHRDKARIVGLSIAIFIRIALLALASYITHLTRPLFYIVEFAVSGKDILMLSGGFFLIYKATVELHEKITGHAVQYVGNPYLKKTYTALGTAIFQIVVIDAIFSIDSVITAVAMVDHITIAMAAVTVAMLLMMVGSKYMTEFLEKFPTLVMLSLGFLLMIGLALILEGLHIEVPKKYLYAAICFALLIEFFNQLSTKNEREKAFSAVTWRRKSVDSILGMMGIRETILKKSAKNGMSTETQEVFNDSEKHMIRSVLTLAERPIEAIMTPRKEIKKLNLSKKVPEQKQELARSPFSRMVVVGRAGIDEPLGYINKKDVLTELLTTGENEVNLNKLIKQPLFIPATTTVLAALELFRHSKADLGLVTDEFGAILGLVSMKDILETIAGEFPEEYETGGKPPIEMDKKNNSLTVDGAIDYDTVAQILNFPPLSEEANFHSIAGLVMEELQQLPNVGDAIDYYNHRFEVVEKTGNRIDRVKISPLRDTETESDA